MLLSGAKYSPVYQMPIPVYKIQYVLLYLYICEHQKYICTMILGNEIYIWTSIMHK